MTHDFKEREFHEDKKKAIEQAGFLHNTLLKAIETGKSYFVHAVVEKEDHSGADGIGVSFRPGKSLIKCFSDSLIRRLTNIKEHKT